MSYNWDFDDGKNGFRYSDGLFGETASGKYAKGTYKAKAGLEGDGALFVRLGGRDDTDVSDISGGWTKSFDIDERSEAEVTIRFKIKGGTNMESDEHAEFRLALDGEAYGADGKDYIARLRGDGEGGGGMSTGWEEVTISLGRLKAGSHELDLGGYLNAKTAGNEKVKFLIDEVSLNIEPADGDDTKVDLDAFEAEVLALTNAFRAENGLDPLRADARLAAAAEDWSREMAEGDMFRHSDTAEQVEAEGYEWQSLGENIAAGYATPEDVVEGWIGSDGHRANMLREDFEEIGIGYVHREDDSGDAPFGHYWTQIFATEADILI